MAHSYFPLYYYIVTSELGMRSWQAESREHAREQHEDAFPDEEILNITRGALAEAQ